MKRLLLASIVLAVPLVAPSAAAGGGGCHGEIDRDAKGVGVALTQFCFDPLVVRVQSGQTVTWTNRDDVSHNVVGAAYKWGMLENDLSQGDSVSFTFSRPGTFPYVCMFHPGMVGAVVVGNGVRAAGEDSGVGIKHVALKRANAAAVTTAATEPEPVETEKQTAAAPAPVAPAPPADTTTTPLSSGSSDRGPMVAAAIAIGAALVVGAVVMLARRTPRARELVG